MNINRSEAVERRPLLEGQSQTRPTSYGAGNQVDVEVDPLNINADYEHFAPEGSWHKRKNVPTATKPAAHNILNSDFESLDYDICENHLLLDEERSKGYKFILKKNLARWFIFWLIGVITALIGCCIDVAVEEAAGFKFKNLKNYVDLYVEENRLYIPYVIWLAFNVLPVAVGALLVTYIEPVAAGSGIPQVKCYLNGVKIPRIVRIKTLVVKAFGVVTSVVGGLAAGKEGPMIHSGAVVAAGLSQGKSTTFHQDLKIFEYFREDHEKRDFVSGGAAAGVASAFGAPVGGVLFSLEEGASFWNQSLTWRIFFSSMISAFTLNIVLSAYHGHPGELSYAGLLNFGKFYDITYDLKELPIFMVMGCIGGLLGSLFNYINMKITVMRMRYVKRKWLKVLEAVFVAVISASIAFAMIIAINDCKPRVDEQSPQFPVKFHCEEGSYSAVAALWFQTPEASVRLLFHGPAGSHKALTVGVFFLLYFILSVVTYGLSVSGGLFIPALLTGAAWGRLVGIALQTFFPTCAWIDPGKYALVGAAAHLGGMVRMTISLTVILIEATGNITFGLPLMLTLIMAKWIGDFFTEGIYDIHIQLMQVPLMPWEPPPLSNFIYASEVMNHPVCVFRTVENVGVIVDVLKEVKHNGFPVVDPCVTEDQGDQRSQGTFRGLILRSQLIVLLNNKIFNESSNIWNLSEVSLKLFRDHYPRFSTIEEVAITEEERLHTVDLRPYMNQSPYTVQHSASMPRVFRLFRGLGLRHLTVVNDCHEVVGIVTRKDLARFRVWRHQGRMGMEELIISEET
ncbi:H(+)/Cl(-) exchange transporter 7 [Bacillus rossius redtenbacheri]|uniref:H(+)/Cl(-) exchange transporter 7 n=1 Tax=Bacillus rossius redtenbacheri TaxID=93214 RepID=UPI002FDD5498